MDIESKRSDRLRVVLIIEIKTRLNISK